MSWSALSQPGMNKRKYDSEAGCVGVYSGVRCGHITVAALHRTKVRVRDQSRPTCRITDSILLQANMVPSDSTAGRR